MEADSDAREHIGTFTRQPRRARQRKAMTSLTSRSDQVSRRQFNLNATVRIQNLDHQEIKLPKATALGIARESSASFAATNNNEEILNSRISEKANRGVNTAVVEASSRNMKMASTHQTLSTILVRAEQRTDKFCSILKVGNPKGK
jgi:hypothetical protein